MAGILTTSEVTWANSAAAGTVVNVDLGPNVPGPNHRRYAITVHNPGASALTVKVQAKERLRGNDRFAELTTFPVAAGATKQVTVEDAWLAGDGGRLALSNDTAIGAAGGFTGDVRVRQI